MQTPEFSTDWCRLARKNVADLYHIPDWCPLRNDAVLIHIHDDALKTKEADDQDGKEAEDA